MKRRTILGAVGVGIGTIAGCGSQLGPGGSPSDGPANRTQTPTTSEGNMTDGTRIPAGETTRMSIGSGTLTEDGSRKPHAFVLRNSTTSDRTGRLVVRRPDESVVHDGAYELESEAVVLVELTDPLQYSATASLAGTDVSKTAEVSLENYDCNSSSTTFDIQAADRIEIETVTTEILCMNLETEQVDVGEEHTRSLGDGSLPDDDRKPHDVRITNPTDETWTTRLILERDGEVVLDGLYTLRSEAAVVVTLTEAGDYQGTVSIPATGVDDTFKPGPFDCNDSSTIVTVQSSGELDVQTITTDIACGSTDTDGTETTGQ